MDQLDPPSPLRHDAGDPSGATPDPVHDAAIARDAGVATWEWRPGDERVLASESARWLLGVAPGAPAPTRGEFFARLLPEDRRRVMASEQGVFDAVGERVPFAYEFRIRTDEGTVRWLRSQGVLLRTPGRDPLLRGVMLDVTAQRARSARIAAALRAAGSEWCELDLETQAVSGSAGFAALMGIGAHETITSLDALVARVHPGDRAHVEAALLAARGGAPVSTVFRVDRADGTSVRIEATALLTRDDDGRATRLVGVLRDVTARHRDAERLRESEEHHRALFAHHPLPVLLVDSATDVILDANAAACALYDLDRLSLGTITKRMLLAPDDVAPYAESREHADHPYTRQARHRARDGRVLDVIATSEPVTHLGRPARIVVITDITARRATERALAESEARYRMLAEATQDLICRHAPDGTYAYVSPSVTALTGWLPQEMIGRDPYDFIHPDDAELVRARAHYPAQDGVASMAPITYRARRTDGSWIWLETSTMPVHDEAGQVIAIVTSSRDVSQRHALEEQLRHVAKMDAVGTLAGGVAHDFNNILTVIRGSVEALGDLLGSATGESRDEVEAIDGAVTRAQALTRQLLSFARKQVEQVTTVALDEVIVRAAPLLRRLLRGGQRLQLACEAQAQLVTLDVAELELALMNLVSNARAAMDDTGVVTLATHVCTVDAETPPPLPGLRAGAWLCVTVRDTGPGMPDSVKARLFEPFFTTKPVGEGTGLGLATVYGVVQRAGGMIDVASAPGEGTTFTLWLPSTTTTGTLASPAVPDAPPTAPVPGVAPMALVVDDEAMVRAIMVRVLRRAGYVVHEAASGDEALALLATHAGCIGVLVTDFAMPGMTGRMLLERALAQWPHLATVLVSGYTSDDATRQALQRSRTRFLAKPFTPTTLLATVRAALGDDVGAVATASGSEPHP